DESNSALVHLDPIQRRPHPFAFPGIWERQFKFRFALAKRHVQAAVERALKGHPSPFLGDALALPQVLKPPSWVLSSGTVAANHPLPRRTADGWVGLA